MLGHKLVHKLGHKINIKERAKNSGQKNKIRGSRQTEELFMVIGGKAGIAV